MQEKTFHVGIPHKEMDQKMSPCVLCVDIDALEVKVEAKNARDISCGRTTLRDGLEEVCVSAM